MTTIKDIMDLYDNNRVVAATPDQLAIVAGKLRSIKELEAAAERLKADVRAIMGDPTGETEPLEAKIRRWHGETKEVSDKWGTSRPLTTHELVLIARNTLTELGL